MRLRLIAVAVLLFLSGFQDICVSQINTSSDDYASAFRTTSSGKLEFWFTSSRLTKDGRARAIYIAPCSDTGFGTPRLAPSPINQQQMGENEIPLDGTPAFAACDGSIGVFGSNRLVGGKYFGNDLYEMRPDGNNWIVTRLDVLNSPDWDDSPALSPDGNRIYFASDRRHPGTRKADLYFSERQGNSWSEPRYLDDVNTSEFSEETPYVSEDNYLYYSTNRTGDYDIWRVKLGANGLPSATPESVAGVNHPGTDETHPEISAGGGFFMFSSNATNTASKGDFNIAWIKVKRSAVRLELDIRKRHRQTTERVAARVHFNTNGYERTLDASPNEPMDLALSDFLRDPSSPAADNRYFETVIYADPDDSHFVTSRDTLTGYRTCSTLLPHTLFLWDTATYYEQNCVDTFPIKKVQYFVTGYWCPTTKKYAQYMECPSLFVDPACLVPVCAPTELNVFKIQVERLHSECIDYAEFDKKGPSFSSAVDDAIEQHLNAMESAFGSVCMKRTIAQHKPVTVVVEGFTDPRSYGGDCHYFGPDIDFSHSGVQVPDEMKSHFTHGVAMKKYGVGGNQLLSELRAYNLAVLLDKVWTERIPQYRDLKQQGLLRTIAIGRAISQDAITFEQRRSAQVSINAENDTQPEKGERPQPGEKVLLCNSCR